MRSRLFQTGIFLVAASIVFLFSTQVYAAPPSFPFVAEVSSDQVNVRAGQSSNFEKVHQLSKNDQVLVVGQSYSWYKIRLPKLAKSFIADKYVKLLDDSTGEIMAKAVNIRAAADVNSSSVGQLNAGSRVRILEKKAGWYRIEPIEESYGWVADKFITFKSKDIATYADKATPVITPAAAVAKETPEDKTSAPTTAFKGIIQPSLDRHFYMLNVDQHPAYTLQGLPTDIMDQFAGYEVSVEGTSLASQDTSPVPVLNVSKIQLVL